MVPCGPRLAIAWANVIPAGAIGNAFTVVGQGNHGAGHGILVREAESNQQSGAKAKQAVGIFQRFHPGTLVGSIGGAQNVRAAVIFETSGVL
ncbi:major tail sheath protein|nr:major tail sheath protein [Candidatus Pantoea persica]